MLEKPTRRGFITGLVAFVAAPAIVRASSLMPISAAKLTGPSHFGWYEGGYSPEFMGDAEVWIQEWVNMIRASHPDLGNAYFEIANEAWQFRQ